MKCSFCELSADVKAAIFVGCFRDKREQLTFETLIEKDQEGRGYHEF